MLCLLPNRLTVCTATYAAKYYFNYSLIMIVTAQMTVVSTAYRH